MRMNYGLRLTGALCTVLLLAGCSNSRESIDTRTYHGAFNMIVMEVENLQQQVNAETYTGQYSPIEDQLGSAIFAFMSNADVKGTPLEAEAQKLADQEAKIMEIWKSSDMSIDKIRSAAKEMLDQVEHMKTII
jgi:aminopeptidase-like protein